MTELIVPSRFCGPPSSGNGGWTAGALAAHVLRVGPSAGQGASKEASPTVRVVLRMPPPLDVALQVTEVDQAVRLLDGADRLVAEASLSEADLTPVDAVDPETAQAAEATYPGLVSHEFATCFVCGPDRAPGDGLRIFPGVISEPGATRRVAATWVPDASLVDSNSDRDASDSEDEPTVGLAATWAALDCSGGWAGDLEERLMLLGTMTARVDALPLVGERHVLVGEHRGTEGRKTRTAVTMYDSDGRVVALAEHVWIAVDPASMA